MDELTFDIAVLGGGASGMAAALSAVRANSHLRVGVLERQSRVGKKLLATGNGRCNLTNMDAARLGHYHGGAYLARAALSAHPPKDILAFFRDLGLEAVPDEEGRVYPLSDQAGSVVDVLRLSMEESGVVLTPGFEACQVRPGFAIRARDGRVAHARRLVICLGGPAGEKLGGTRDGHKLLRELGHDITPIYPALCQIKTEPESVRALKGLRFRGDVSLLDGDKVVQRERGEVLFTDYGLSGIAAMSLSRRCAQILTSGSVPRVRLGILPLEEKLLAARREMLRNRRLEDFLTGPLARRVGQHMLKMSGIGPLSRTAASLTTRELSALAATLSGWTVRVTGVFPVGDAQVTAGGADARAFDPDTLESRIVPGLYAAGEVLDIDGDCGGFNLTWAWASGLLAGTSAARSL